MFEILIFGFALLSVYVISGTYLTPVIAAVITAGILSAGALVMVLKQRKPRAKELALKAGAFVLFAALIFGFGRLNNIHARRGAVQLANVCEQYKSKTGAYPDGFAKLIPDYIKDIPVAKITVMWAQYRLVDNKIMFVLEPGLLAESYDLATKKWHISEVAEMFPTKIE
jgi:predicted PurR-regulated permease PerM